MKILLLTLGTRGDVQPFVALGVGLKAAGHEVSVCAPSSFAPLVTEHGLTYAPMSDEIVQLARAQEGREILGAAGSPLGLLKGWLRLARRVGPMQRRVLDDAWAAAPGTDALVYHPKVLGGTDLGERLKVPVFLVLPAPALVPTRVFPAPVLPPLRVPLSLQGVYNRLTYRLPQLMNVATAGVVNKWREEALELPARPAFQDPLRYPDGRAVPVLHPFSPHIAAPPADWSADVAVTGCWILTSEWRMPSELREFLRAGPPPAYVGFGSIAGRNPAQTTQTVVGALERAGQRGVLSSGWGGLGTARLPGTVFKLDAAPHDLLFPHMAAVVHHGGAGTTAAGLRAGKPTVVCPFFGDQPFWGARVAALGVGPAPIPQRRLTAENLAAAIRRAVTDTEMQGRAYELGVKLRAEDGVGRAVQFIETYVTAWR